MKEAVRLLESVKDDQTAKKVWKDLETMASQWIEDYSMPECPDVTLKSRLWYGNDPIPGTTLYPLMNSLFIEWKKINTAETAGIKLDIVLEEYKQNGIKWKGNHPWGLEFVDFE